jgi:hypothetical protein
VSFTDAELDAAVIAISDTGRLNAAQDVVARAAPGLQKVLASALHEGGWFDTAHEAAVKEAIELEDPQQRLTAIRTLFAEETRLSMLVGVAVGFELSRELGYAGDATTADNATDRKD